LPSLSSSCNILRIGEAIEMHYSVVLEPAEEGGFVIHCPVVGVSSQGETREEALKNIVEAVEAYLESQRMLGLPVPEEHGALEVTTVEVAA
jgi:predicted RNase H-like HicB family nuclease